MNYTIENYNKDGFEVIIGYDDYAEHMFDDLWHGVSFISNHRDYADKGDMSHIRIESILDGDIPEGYEVAKIHAYIHGGISLSLGSFSCPWDSGVFGFLLFKTIEDENEVLESCGGFDDMDYMEKEIESILKGLKEDKHRQRLDKVKTLIKNRVPLQKRSELIA